MALSNPLALAFIAACNSSLLLSSTCAQPVRAGGELVLTKEITEEVTATGAGAWNEAVALERWQNGMVEGQLSYAFKKVKLLGSVAVYHTWEAHNANLLELRPWQGVTVQFPDWKFFPLRHRFLFEERWQFERGHWSFSPRGRYRISSRIPVTTNADGRTSSYGFLAAEWYNNFNKPLRERYSSSRIYIIGAGLRLSSKSALEVRYYSDVTENVRENILDVDVHTWQIRWINDL